LDVFAKLVKGKIMTNSNCSWKNVLNMNINLHGSLVAKFLLKISLVICILAGCMFVGAVAGYLIAISPLSYKTKTYTSTQRNSDNSIKFHWTVTEEWVVGKWRHKETTVRTPGGRKIEGNYTYPPGTGFWSGLNLPLDFRLLEIIIEKGVIPGILLGLFFALDYLLHGRFFFYKKRIKTCRKKV